MVLQQLEVLRDAVLHREVMGIASNASASLTVLAFMEAVCSNIVEGLNLPILLAKWATIDGDLGAIPTQYTSEALDVAQCYLRCRTGLVGRSEIRTCKEFVAHLQMEHRQLFGHRPDINPGSFKRWENSVGGRLTVPPEQVHQTLQDGFLMCKRIPAGLSRAVLLEYLIVAVHPFEDGNGRISRLIANNHLSAHNLHRQVVQPTKMKLYVQGLRHLADQADGQPLWDWWIQAQLQSARVSWVDIRNSVLEMEALGLLSKQIWMSSQDERQARAMYRECRRNYEQKIRRHLDAALATI